MQQDKGKGKLIDPREEEDEEEEVHEEDSGSEETSTSDSDTDTESDSGSDDDSSEGDEEEDSEPVAGPSKPGTASKSQGLGDDNEDEIALPDDPNAPLPRLDSGLKKSPYIRFGETRLDGASLVRNPDLERAEKLLGSLSVPMPPIGPPELSKSGKPLTKKEKKALRQKTAGPDWFDMPAPAEADLPRLHREVEALRLRNQLDPKRFYRKDEGEGKGIKGLPKYFAIGTILPTKTPFGTPTEANLTRAQRKRTLVDELVDDAEAKRYAKKKFNELQSVRTAKGKKTLHKKLSAKQTKW